MTFQDIEDGIISALQAQVPYLKTVETYAGQLDKEIAELPRSFPAAYVAYQGSKFEWVDGENWQEWPTFKVLIAARSLRIVSGINEDVRKGTEGAYQAVTDVLAALTNQTFGLAIYKLRPERTELVFVNKTTAIYGIDFTTMFDAAYQ
ncbi:MAG: DUF1834 family protein [Nitrospiraceae bacterium]|nr:DUF1834 family protein [Nitrospiraceae bacterium]